jgi:hypothetical protein
MKENIIIKVDGDDIKAITNLQNELSKVLGVKYVYVKINVFPVLGCLSHCQIQ